ncbi:MAG: hypothetical protein A3I61_04795 [Acidobacteria bacterium RIFCSPLOWO2_02_FULL_68_18]|nr:MAG: hypothetical protein A3I61_04795 [Acidobacteria bacterium RIFCSPLOWO2_02_FULL_68_18]OFW49133.1 MAG: hypothetical protein A3G77_10230 [Acidobacteria bacterium RIFCSPLOWO2_12_FULL_68_19]
MGLVVIILSWLAVPLEAATLVVDQDGQASATSCGAAQSAFSAIGAAIAAAANGDTIVVCPGTGPYDEQVVVNKALTIRGFAQTEAIIGPAAVVANTTSLYSGAPIAALVVVTDTSATLTNLVVDGSDAGLGGSGCGAVPNLVGVFYRNASGTLSDSTVRNIRLAPGLEGCQAGIGVFAQSGGGGQSNLVVDGVSVRGFQKNGIVGNETGTTITVKNSVVQGDPPNNVAVQNGVQIGFGATGTITENRILELIYSPCTHPYEPGGGCDTGASFGVIVFDAGDGLQISSNTIGNTQVGVYIGGGIIGPGTHGTEVVSNLVAATHVFHGIVIVGGGNTVNKNIITSSDGVGVFLSGDANLVISNRIQEAMIGVWDFSGVGNSYPTSGARPNRIINVTLPTAGGSLASLAARSSSSDAKKPAPMAPLARPGRF